MQMSDIKDIKYQTQNPSQNLLKRCVAELKSKRKNFNANRKRKRSNLLKND